MRMEVATAYMAQAKATGAKAGYKYRLVGVTVPVDLTELTGEDCPVAVRVGTEEYRAFDGGMFVAVRTDGEHVGAAWLTARPRTGPELTYGEGRRDVTTPEASLSVMRGFEAAREEAVAKALAIVADLVVIDGKAWSRAGDPVLALDRTRDGTARLGVREAEPRDQGGTFRLDDEEAFGAYLRRACPEAADLAVPDFELLDASALRHDPQEALLRRAARHAAGAASASLREVGVDALVAYARARDMGARRPDPMADGRPEKQVLCDLLDEMNAAFPGCLPPYAKDAVGEHADVVAARAARAERDEEETASLTF